VPIIQVGLAKDPIFRNVPLSTTRTGRDQRQMFALVSRRFEWGQPFATNQGVLASASNLRKGSPPWRAISLPGRHGEDRGQQRELGVVYGAGDETAGTQTTADAAEHSSRKVKRRCM